MLTVLCVFPAVILFVALFATTGMAGVVALGALVVLGLGLIEVVRLIVTFFTGVRRSCRYSVGSSRESKRQGCHGWQDLDRYESPSP